MSRPATARLAITQRALRALTGMPTSTACSTMPAQHAPTPCFDVQASDWSALHRAPHAETSYQACHSIIAFAPSLNCTSQQQLAQQAQEQVVCSPWKQGQHSHSLAVLPIRGFAWRREGSAVKPLYFSVHVTVTAAKPCQEVSRLVASSVAQSAHAYLLTATGVRAPRARQRQSSSRAWNTRRAPKEWATRVTGRSPWAPRIRRWARRCPAFCARSMHTAQGWSISCAHPPARAV